MSCQKDKLIPKLIIVSIIMTIIETGKMPDTYLTNKIPLRTSDRGEL